MAVYTQVSAEALGALLSDYDVGSLVSAKGIAEGVENSNYLVDTTGGRFILTLYEKRVDAGDLPFFMALLDRLADQGLPVPRAIRDRNGAQIQQVAGRPPSAGDGSGPGPDARRACRLHDGAPKCARARRLACARRALRCRPGSDLPRLAAEGGG